MKNKRVISLIVLFVLLFTSFDLTAFAEKKDKDNGKRDFIVKFIDKVNVDKELKGKKLKKKYKHAPLASVELTESELLQLIKSNTVEYIEEDTVIQLPTTDVTSEPIIESEPKENVASVGNREAQAKGIDGTGIKIAVFDTGITANDSIHVAGGASFVEGTKEYNDNNGHGTYIASLISGKTSEFQGIAVGAELYSVKVLDDNAQGTYSQVIEAIEWAVDNNMDIVNMSFGADVYSNALADAMKYAYDNGVLLVAAAGNDSDSLIDYPARFHSVIAVGAVDQKHIRASFSNIGTELELMASGVDVAGLDSNGKTVLKSGTSSSTANVSAIAALYLQAFQGISNMEVRELLNTSAMPIGDVSEYGNGLAQFTHQVDQTDNTLMSEEEENEWIKQEIVKQEDKAKKRERAKKEREEKKKKEKKEYELTGKKTENVIKQAEEEQEQNRPDASQRELSERIQRKLDKLESKEKQQENESTVTRNIDVIANEWGVSVAEIQVQLDKGFTLEEVETAIRQQKQERKSTTLSGSLEKNKKTQVNESEKAESEIKSDVGSLDLKTANVFSASSAPPDPEVPNLDMLKLETGEAPYRVSLENESVSTLSGSLSVSESDLSLPGRNGNGFTLTRTYDSNNSQFYDMDVDTVSSTVNDYYVIISGSERYWKTTYYLSYYQRQVANKYACSDGRFITTVSDSNIGHGSSSYNTQAARDAASNSLSANPTIIDRSDCAAYDRYRVTSYTLYKTSSSSVDVIGNGTYSRYLGPYATQNQANTAMQSVTVGAADFSTYPSGNPNDVQIAITRTIQGKSIHTEPRNSYYYVNRLVDAKEEKKFPIGKGWSWNIPYLTFDRGTYVHFAGDGTYKVENQTLKGYLYKDIRLVSDTTVTVNGTQSAYALKFRAGEKQYFSSDGLLLQISDAYNNRTQFKYANVSPYGKVLTSITDAIGNEITIGYTSDQVTLTLGDRQVVYKKTVQNNKELLTQVIDPMNRVTTYDYHIANASFNLLGSNPVTSNPYALLTGVTHPTGAKTIYEYEGAPVKRYTSSNSVNEAYRIAVRKDSITYSDSTTEEFNRAAFLYPHDMGSSYNQDFTFTTKLMRGPVESIYTYRKDYIDDTTAPMFYNTKIEASDLALKRVTEHTYDEANRNPLPISTTNYFVSGTGQSTKVTTSAQYDTWGNLISETDPLGNQSTYEYDGTSHLLTSSKTPAGVGKSLYIQLVRNLQGDITDYVVRDNHASGTLLRRNTYDYDTFGNIKQTKQHGTDRIALVTFTYDNLSAFPVKASYSYTDADGVAQTSDTEATYDTLTGEMKSFRDGRGNLTSYSIDKLGRTIQVTNPDQTTISVVYDDINNQVTTTNEANKKSVTKFNAVGLQIEAGIYENGIYVSKSKAGYDSLNRNIWVEESTGNRTLYAYDNWDRSVKATNPDGTFSTISYDELSYTNIATDEEGNATLNKYDQFGRLLFTQLQKNGAYYTAQSYSYDELGRVISTQDALNHITNNSYDSLGQLTSVTNAKQETTSYQYDQFGNLTALVYPDGSKVLKRYDELGRLQSQTDQLGKIKKIYYDAAGNMNKFVDRKGITFTYSYDTRNRLTNRISPSETISYTYTVDGLRKSMTDQTGTTSYSYDESTGELTGQTYPDNKEISYTYDGSGNLTSTAGPFSHLTSYKYDNVNRMQTVMADSQQSASYSYLKNDKIDKIEYANGISSEFTFDGLLMTQMQHKKQDGTVLNSYSYSFDLTGNITQRSENETTHDFSYDALGRVETNTQYNETYEYDVKGNRETIVSDALPDLEEAYYEYDDWNRLTKVTTSEGVITYKYNGDDRMVERSENGETIRYYWSNDRIVAEGVVQDGVVSEKATYIYGLGLLEQIDGGNSSRSSFLMNGHGDVVELRDMQGSLQNQYTYDIWGKPLTASETVDNPFRYSGEYWDDSVDLQYLRARWYDPKIARFINEDTYEGKISNPLSLNLYTYVSNNPLRYTDPSGNKQLAEGSGGGLPLIPWYFPPPAVKYLKDALEVGFKIAATSIATAETVGNKKRKNDDIILYHATNNESVDSILAGIDLTAGRVNLDFGQGFYVTTNANQAEEWVQRKFDGNGAVMAFAVDKDVFDDYNGKTFKNLKELSEFVYKCRNSDCNHEYDYVSGMYLTNPYTRVRSVLNGKRVTTKVPTKREFYSFTGQQISIHNQDLADQILEGYVGSRYY
ncbi:S8 family serine peptidase [Paenibacillus arenilitoris]|uniref:S8 family serine peptidase n=1 Tax=Paenibacillus arenilitoris TaxID=2772299 RepID=A0A927H8J1_9BACL|nr:S8 family serine peptidase [Paenibacillus arenilitoris]MBD2872135.1 S8 family serine peptidase [Paenibacillus arenilitoris]